MLRVTLMTKADDKKLLTQAREAGRRYASEQIEGEYFSDYVAQQVYAAEKDPDHHWSVRTKSDAMRAAKNTLIDLGHDISRDLSGHDALRYAKLSSTRDVSPGDLLEAFNNG